MIVIYVLDPATGDLVLIPTLPADVILSLRVFPVIKTKSLVVVVLKDAKLVKVAFVALLKCNLNPIGDRVDGIIEISIS